MNDLPDYTPSHKRSKVIAWLSALAGLVLLNLAADRLASRHTDGWPALIAGLAMLAYVLWRASKRN